MWNSKRISCETYNLLTEEQNSILTIEELGKEFTLGCFSSHKQCTTSQLGNVNKHENKHELFFAATPRKLIFFGLKND